MQFLSDLCRRPYTCQHTWERRSFVRPFLTVMYASSLRPKQLRIRPFMAWVSPCSLYFGLLRICLANLRPFLYCLCSQHRKIRLKMPFSFGGRVTLLGIFNAGQLKEASEIKTRFKIYKLSLKLQIFFGLYYYSSYKFTSSLQENATALN